MRVFLFSFLVLVMAGATLRAMAVTITNQPASRALWAGGNVKFVAGVSNAGAFSYQWQRNSKNLTNNIITTVAGIGTSGNTGDGGVATNAEIFAQNVAVDAAGDLYIAQDFFGNSIRKVDTNGIITTIAGGGANNPGDGGAATNASLSVPVGVAVDAAGNLYIADTGNSRIRKVDTNGVITTVAGNGVSGYSGDGGAATNAEISHARGVALDLSGNMFISDFGNNVIRKVGTNGVISTVAGNGSSGFSGDGGAATSASFNNLYYLGTDSNGDLFIADNSNDRIRELNTNGIITTVAGNGTQSGDTGDGGQATNAGLTRPFGVTVDANGNLLIADNFGIREVNTNGIISTVAGNGVYTYSGDGGLATNASLSGCQNVVVDAADNLFIADQVNERIRKVTNTQRPILALNNASAANAGSYQLVVTGAGGSVTSSVAQLIVATAPIIYKTTHNSNGSMALNFVCQPGSTNTVSCITNLLQTAAWQSISTNFAGPDGNWQYTDTNATSYKSRFYRSLTH